MANNFQYTAGREGDHAVTMCVKPEVWLTWAQRVDFDTANKIGAAGGYQCEELAPGFYAGSSMVDVIPVCIKEDGTWQLRYTTPSTGNQAWNFGLDSSTAHAYQSTVLPPVTSECEEPFVATSNAPIATVMHPQSLPTSLPAVGSGSEPLMALGLAVVICGMLLWRRKTRKTTKSVG